MAKKLNSMPDYTARMPKQPHDVSQSFAFSACPGMILPVYFDMLHHGDELHFSASEFVRMNPLVNQTMAKIDVHLDYFFVPLTVMYTPASSLFYQTDDLVTTAIDRDSLLKESFPVFNFQDFLDGLTSGDDNAHYSDPCIFQGTSAGDDIQYLPAEYFDCFGKSVYRLFDHLDMDPNILLTSIDESGSTTYGIRYTPWFALAYQAIYQLYFRNDDRERKNYHYNIDKYADGSTWYDQGFTHKSIFQINYVNKPKDYFNSVKVSPIGSSVSMLSSAFNGANVRYNVNTWLTNGSANGSAKFFGGVTNNDGIGTTFSDDSVTQVMSGTVPGPGVFISSSPTSATAIRQLFMVDKLLRVIGRTEKNYESQFLAHYGIKVPHDVMHNITHIGHDVATLTPETVISSANTYNSSTGDGSSLGELGGQGSVMLSGKKRSFTAPFHGVFMVVSHIVPRFRYVVGLNKLHQLNSPSDFWQPEFDKKGMQPLFDYEVSGGSSSFRYGWQFAYEQFKRKVDRVSNVFRPNRRSDVINSWSSWVLSERPYTFFSNTGANRLPVDAPDGNSVQANWLLSSPNDLNNIMLVPHSTAWPVLEEGVSLASMPWLLYQTDPFMCDFNLYCKKVNGMSEYGEPEL